MKEERWQNQNFLCSHGWFCAPGHVCKINSIRTFTFIK